MLTLIEDQAIRAIHQYVDSEVAHLGFIVNAGTRDEQVDEHGVAHLIEHMLFKGTDKRNYRRLAKRFDDFGADLNAYTTKEDTCIYVSFRPEHYKYILEVLADIIFHANFPQKELEKEIEVIKEEIMSYKDMPAELIYDEFEDYLYDGYSIGRNILGTEESLDAILNSANIKNGTLKDSVPAIDNYLYNNYFNENIIFWSAGKISPTKFKQLYVKYFSESRNSSMRKNYNDKPAPRFDIDIERFDYQSHVVIGCNTCSYHDERKDAFILLNHYLCHPGMSSRLNYRLREKHGYVYQIDSSYTPYVDLGNFNIYYECDKSKINKINEIIFDELKRCMTKKIGSLSLNILKRQVKTNLAIMHDSAQYNVASMAKSLMIYDDIPTIKELYDRIDAVSAEDLLKVANDFLKPENLSILKYV